MMSKIVKKSKVNNRGRKSVIDLTAHLKQQSGGNWSNTKTYSLMDRLLIPSPGNRGWSSEEFTEICTILEQSEGLVPLNSMVGADPEFEVLNSEGVVQSAYDYIRGGTRAQVGTDGASSTGELRPSPGSPEKVTDNVHKLLRELHNTLPDNFQIRAGSGRTYSLGGHVHISGAERSDELTGALERFVAGPLNAKSNHSFRRGVGYGNEREIRNQPHGWEYRTPCSWIAHPDLTAGVLVITWSLSQMTRTVVAGLETREQLYEAMGVRSMYARKFYELLDSIRRIERIKVFAAWKIEEGDDGTDQPPPESFPITMGSEYALELLQGNYETTRGDSVVIRGARNTRSPGRFRIYVPSEWRVPRNSSGSNIRMESWEVANTIGISRALRSEMHASTDVLSNVESSLRDILSSNEDMED